MRSRKNKNAFEIEENKICKYQEGKCVIKICLSVYIEKYSQRTLKVLNKLIDPLVIDNCCFQNR